MSWVLIPMLRSRNHVTKWMLHVSTFWGGILVVDFGAVVSFCGRCLTCKSHVDSKFITISTGTIVPRCHDALLAEFSRVYEHYLYTSFHQPSLAIPSVTLRLPMFLTPQHPQCLSSAASLVLKPTGMAA